MEGDLNRRIGWITAALGVSLGMLLGLWSFDGPLAVPAGLGDYGSTPRRLVRLGHIALIALGMLDVLVGRELGTLRLAARGKRLLAGSMAAGNVLLPLALFVAALVPIGKYLTAPPALCVALALWLAVIGSWHLAPLTPLAPLTGGSNAADNV
jgi:hypothetical protein